MLKLNVALDVNAFSVLMKIVKHDDVAVVERKAQIVLNLPECIHPEHGAGVESGDQVVRGAVLLT